ncbi:MAG: ABC transporter permease [Dehalococcoidia bacterium]|nr:ABC transporter permease [Dehalococcoidia bacterium]MCA9856642.1 ABC transporter permease [Dehalococcoidia bacterium]MCB9484143.1 ABC transporter permease [Dehalococcoidia bacterium]MCB9491177.1 ABC transporter permease [Dehalococcoidia bacterium]
MLRFMVRRLASTIPVLLIVSMLTFSLTNVLGGDPLLALMGEEEGRLSPEAEAIMREELGLNDPLPVQYMNWLLGAVRGDLGESIQTGQPVTEALLERLPVTIQLGMAAWVFAISLAIPLGVLAAISRNTWKDQAATAFALAGVATPSFWMGLMLILLFAVWLRWLPPSGFTHLWENPVDAAKHLVLPGVTLGVNLIGTVARQTRSAMLEVLGQDYIRTARAKGLGQRVVLTRHALRNAMLPVVTVLGLQFANLLGGTVIIEQVFAIPGVGRLTLGAVFAQDLPVVQGAVLLAALATLAGNLWADIMYTVFDPRIRVS